MFGMGWQEILLILVVAVLVIGPDQIPQVARTIGKLMAQFRRATNDLRDTMNREFNDSTEFKDFRDFQNTIDAEVRSIGHTAQEYVEKEVAQEEAELKKLEEEVKATAGDPGVLTEPKAPVPAWEHLPSDMPPEAPALPADAPTEAVATNEEPAQSPEREAPAEAGGAAASRKESA